MEEDTARTDRGREREGEVGDGDEGTDEDAAVGPKEDRGDRREAEKGGRAEEEDRLGVSRHDSCLIVVMLVVELGMCY